MAKQARPMKPARPKRPAKKAPARARKVSKKKVHRYLCFADLHVSPSTLDCALRVLDRVAELAEKHDATPVCLGDFWHLRGHLVVRHVDEVLKRVEQWRQSYFIPGNHDQVSLDGSIHGLNIFSVIPQIHVVTSAHFDHARGAVFLPWRENHLAQQALFESVGVGDEGPWTIFAHAEVGGATSNGGHKTPGIIQAKDIESVARACYLGHYHKRQKIGDRTWYIGSPFQQNTGEREWPHGVALVSSDQVEPEFIDLHGFARYWRFNWKDEIDADQIDPDDIVELQAPPDEIGTDAYRAVVDSIPATDVRALPERPEKEVKAPEFALTLDAAIEQHAEQVRESGDDEMPLERLIETGREILGEVPEARAVAPLGTEVKLLSVRTKDFCALQGQLEVDVTRYKRALIQAPIRTGKTALLDAPMWCLYDATTPRKAGVSGATLRADGVIHDDANECEVECCFEVSGEHPKQEVRITRTKKRGSGSKVTIEGIEQPDGIADQDTLIQHVIGLNHALWRACVGLGQGAVANFATDADKRRKDLLSSAFGLEACPKAAKVAKHYRDIHRKANDELEREVLAQEASLETLVGQDFTAQSEAWESRRTTAVNAYHHASGVAQAKATECEGLLKGEQGWVDTKAKHDTHIEAMTKRLAGLVPTVRIAELQRRYGAVEAEKGIAMREVQQGNQHYSKLVEAGEQAACPECGQMLPGASREQHLTDAEKRVRDAGTALSTHTQSLSNIAEELDRLNTGGDAERASVEQSIGESRSALTQCNEAVAQFARIRANLEAAERERTESAKNAEDELLTKNPFEEQAREMQERIAEMQIALDTKKGELAEARNNVYRYEVWVEGFGSKGIPVLVLRTALYDLEVAANRYLGELLAGTVFCQLSMEGDDLKILYFETTPDGVSRERAYEQLSGGQRRCVELAFAPFALSDMIFARCGVRVSLLLIDELTTHMGADEKQRACALLDRMDRDTVLVVDHDVTVQGHFDTKLKLGRRGPQQELQLEQV